MDVNYLRFRNASYENKNFYAFVTDVRYISDNVTEIVYEIDVLQTWAFDYTLNQCFVEREHTADDFVGNHTLPENLETGDIMFKDLGHDTHFDKWGICVCASFDTTLQDARGGLYGGVYSGLAYNTFIGTDLKDACDKADRFLDDVTRENKSDGIVSVFMFPTAFQANRDELTPKSYDVSFPKPTKCGEYTPKNKKLLSFPYTFFNVSDNNGRVANFNYEFFEDNPTNEIKFKLEGELSCSPEFQLVPLKYKGMEKAYNQRLVINDNIQCAYIIDTYCAWLAQNKNNLLVEAVEQGISAATSIARGDFVGATVNTCEYVMERMAQTETIKTQADHTRGKQTTSLNIASGIEGFSYYQAHIKEEYARMIDDFFTKYGYRVNRMKVPNRNVRPWWTYTKTMGCEVTGRMPDKDIKKICEIYNKGITFWRNRADMRVGDYSRDNAPE